MKFSRVFLRLVFSLGIGLSIVKTASATSNETWVSAAGKDSGTCSITTPCASCQYAHNLTTAGGVINVATSGSYGRVVITKSISIIAPEGIQATIAVPSNGTGIEMNGNNGEIIVLKGLVITGPGTSIFSHGIVVDTDFNGHVTIDHVTVTNTEYGITLFGPGFALIESCFIENNGRGLSVNYSFVYMGKTTISGNSFGVFGFGPVNSYGDNIMNGNTYEDTEVAFNVVPHDQ